MGKEKKEKEKKEKEKAPVEECKNSNATVPCAGKSNFEIIQEIAIQPEFKKTLLPKLSAQCRKCFTTHKFGKKNEEAFEKACLEKHKPKTVAPVLPRTHMPTKVLPTNPPSASPTVATEHPTFAPSLTPTATPTSLPSSTPTHLPSRPPTSTPTDVPTAPPSRAVLTKYTAHAGGNGGGPVSSSCKAGKHINYWNIRSGSMVDKIRGRCNDGSWLRTCGGNGGGSWSGAANTQKISVRTGSLVDKFNGRGGNGGGSRTLDCGA